jgi:hypothetical protein
MMNFSPIISLQALLPKATAWAEQVAAEICRTGESLNSRELSIAREVGVLQPESIRIALVDILPFPSDPQLLQAASATGLFGPKMTGITLGYGICIRKGHYSIRLLSHECRHVYQYEQAGSIAAFLRDYLQQIVDHGYGNAPLEIDARSHEIPVWGGSRKCGSP